MAIKETCIAPFVLVLGLYGVKSLKDVLNLSKDFQHLWEFAKSYGPNKAMIARFSWEHIEHFLYMLFSDTVIMNLCEGSLSCKAHDIRSIAQELQMN